MIGTAAILSRFQRDAEAEEAFRRAIRLEGGIEAGFRARYFYARHLWGKGDRELSNGDPRKALDILSLATRTLEEAFETYGLGRKPETYGFLIQLYLSEGRAMEELGEYKGAMEHYEKAARLPSGNRAHYYVATLYGKIAVENWEQRRGSEALFLFMNATHRMSLVTELPVGVKPVEKDNWVRYLERSIRYLEAAKIKRAEKVDF